MFVVQGNKKTGETETVEISNEEYNELFVPFYTAQPDDPTERQIYRDEVDALDLTELGLVTPDLIADYAKYEALRRVYAAKFEGFDRSDLLPDGDGPVSPMQIRWEVYEEISEALSRLIRLNVYGWDGEAEPDAL